ncbi:MAG: hypothetical protein IJ461_02935 [Clostridia bacterium]|nr:hypothetical protein [Clostridia bacterium]
MFENVGGKIKGVAKFMTWFCIFAFVLGGIGLLAAGRNGTVPGVVMLIVGPLVSWVSGLFLYGFGQLIENTDPMANQQPAAPGRRSSRRAAAQDQHREQTLRTMDQWLAEGLITEEEYQQKLDQM